MAKIIKTVGTVTETSAKGGMWALDELQGIVGGYIEITYTRDGDMMIVNEEGLLHDLPFNHKASRIMGFHIVGDVLLVPRSEFHTID